MAAAGFRKSKARSSNQSWSPNSGEVTEDGSQALRECSFPSMTNGRVTAISCCHSHAAIRLAHRLSQPHHYWTNHSVARSGTSLLGTTRRYRDFASRGRPQFHRHRRSSTLTPPVSPDDDAERQDAPTDQDAPMPDAPALHDIATPGRQIGGRCNKWCISAQPAKT